MRRFPTALAVLAASGTLMIEPDPEVLKQRHFVVSEPSRRDVEPSGPDLLPSPFAMGLFGLIAAAAPVLTYGFRPRWRIEPSGLRRSYEESARRWNAANDKDARRRAKRLIVQLNQELRAVSRLLAAGFGSGPYGHPETHARRMRWIEADRLRWSAEGQLEDAACTLPAACRLAGIQRARCLEIAIDMAQEGRLLVEQARRVLAGEPVEQVGGAA